MNDQESELDIDSRLSELLARFEPIQAQLDELAQAMTKLSRTQYKSNALFEAREQKTETALAMLQQMIARSEERALEEQRELSRLRREARTELAVAMLPVIDGIESALESGRALLERRRESRSGPPSLWQRLRYLINSDSLPANENYEALVAWLEGLRLVRERFLSLLAAEDIRPIPDMGQPFDPHLHVAVEAVQSSTVSPGQIVAVSSKGYRQGERVLRYSEVIVVREKE